MIGYSERMQLLVIRWPASCWTILRAQWTKGTDVIVNSFLCDQRQLHAASNRNSFAVGAIKRL